MKINIKLILILIFKLVIFVPNTSSTNIIKIKIYQKKADDELINLSFKVMNIFSNEKIKF